MNRVWTGFIGSIVEAWSELRIHKTRVLLSLIGVAVAVAALTDVVALGQIAEQSQREQSERWGGRPAMLGMYAYDPIRGESRTQELVDEAFDTAMERYEITYTSRNQGGSLCQSSSRSVFRRPTCRPSTPTSARCTGSGWREGQWFTDADNLRLAPAIIVNEAIWEQLGSPPLATHPTITLPGERPTTAVDHRRSTHSPEWDTWPQLFILSSAWQGDHAPEHDGDVRSAEL